MENILSNVRILDFTRVLSGPYATRTLADFGAEIIKVQSRKTEGSDPNTGGYFDTWNRNKRSITLDMSHPEALEIALKLVSICDVVIENFSPRVMANWGMGFDQLKQVKHDIILLSMSGMGQTGPWKNHVAFGPTVHALGGLTHLSSYKEGAPVGPGYAQADHISGLYGAFAVLAALEYRDRTGQGQFIDLSQYEVVASMIAPSLLDVMVNNHDPVPRGNQPDCETAAPHGCYPCLGRNQWCVIAVFNETEWQALKTVMGNPSWALEKKFSTIESRHRHLKKLDKKIAAWTCKQNVHNMVAILQKNGVRAGVVQNAKDLAEDPHLSDRNFFIQTQHPSLGKTMSDRSPINILSEPASDHFFEINLTSSPGLGEANQYVYIKLLGMAESKYIRLIEKGIIT